LFILGIDYLNAVCPCSGLSSLNNSKTPGITRGSNANANKWIFTTAHYVLGRIKPKVFFGENAAGLFTKIGQEIVDELRLVIYLLTICNNFSMMHLSICLYKYLTHFPSV
jgi:site-specific DNA-cytosine methylase